MTEFAWRVAGFCPRRQARIATVGIVLAPDAEAALREALRRWGALFKDLKVAQRGEGPGAAV